MQRNRLRPGFLVAAFALLAAIGCLGNDEIVPPDPPDEGEPSDTLPDQEAMRSVPVLEYLALR